VASEWLHRFEEFVTATRLIAEHTREHLSMRAGLEAEEALELTAEEGLPLAKGGEELCVVTVEGEFVAPDEALGQHRRRSQEAEPSRHQKRPWDGSVDSVGHAARQKR
jgi:hypothetical protein